MLRIVGIGDLVIDYYYKDNVLIGVNGGKTTSNIIFNLSYLGNNTSMLGTCGNDILGDICLNSLKQMNVDISAVDRKKIDTRQFHINITSNDQITKKRCPLCNTKNWYDSSEIKINAITNYLKADDIIVLDELSEELIKIISRLNNKVMIDLGYYQFFESVLNEEIVQWFNYPYEIINMNERVEKYLLERLNLAHSLDLFQLLNARLLIITRGKKGADFIYNNNIYHKELHIVSNEIDPNGAGDMFFASVINDYILNDFNINNELLDVSFKKANDLVVKVVSVVGARSYTQPLYNIKRLDNICSCRMIQIDEKDDKNKTLLKKSI